jgi:carboxymethylenebutenolidase
MTVSVSRTDARLRGGIVLAHEGFGVTDYIRSVADRFADRGWIVAVPHFYHRTGDPSFAYDVDHEVMVPHAAALTTQGILDDVDSAMAALRDSGVPADAVGLVGFCQGGSIAFLADAERDFAAGVTFYGGGIVGGSFGVPPLLELVPRLRAPWLGLYGEQDEWIPQAEVEQLRAAVNAAPVPAQVLTFPEAGHGFHCDARPSYHKASAQLAWTQASEWLDRYVPDAARIP